MLFFPCVTARFTSYFLTVLTLRTGTLHHSETTFVLKELTKYIYPNTYFTLDSHRIVL